MYASINGHIRHTVQRAQQTSCYATELRPPDAPRPHTWPLALLTAAARPVGPAGGTPMRCIEFWVGSFDVSNFLYFL